MLRMLLTKVVRNIKNAKLYNILGPCTNATNAQDGEQGIIYRSDDGRVFYRELNEFNTKFKDTNSHIYMERFCNDLNTIISNSNIDVHLQTPSDIITKYLIDQLEILGTVIKHRQQWFCADFKDCKVDPTFLRSMGEYYHEPKIPPSEKPK